MMRTMIAGIVAGVVVFIWGFISHMVLPLRTAAIRRGPSGILVITPGSKEPMSAAQLGGELLTDILGALVAAILLGMAAVSGFGARVFFVTLLGLFASLAIDFSYWIWYAFPTTYTLAALADQVLGWFCGGLALAKMVKPQRR